MFHKKNAARLKQSNPWHGSLPGLVPDLVPVTSVSSNVWRNVNIDNYKEFRLEAESELRFEVVKQSTVILEMKQGLAEIFGREIILYTKYEFCKGARIAVFTWHGCLLRLSGTPEYSYISKDTPLIQYINIHCLLEEKRKSAEANKIYGPNVMIVGTQDVGKSTLARLLLNYAARMPNRKQIFVDLDIEDNQLSLPGSISSVLVERPLPFEADYPETALVYHYGHINLPANPLFYNAMVSRISTIVRRKLKRLTNVSGVVINTGGYKRHEGCYHLSHIAKEFKVNLIIVLDSERLKHELLNDDVTKNIDTILLQKSGGAVCRSDQSRFELQDARIRQYFYGANGRVHPHAFPLPFSQVRIFRAVCGENGQPTAERVEPSEALLHHLLAMSYDADPGKIATANVVGFLAVTRVDVEAGMFSVLSPQPGPLPGMLFLLSEIQFYDL